MRKSYSASRDVLEPLLGSDGGGQGGEGNSGEGLHFDGIRCCILNSDRLS